MNSGITAKPHEQHMVCLRSDLYPTENAQRRVGIGNDGLQFKSGKIFDRNPAENRTHL